MVGKKVILTFGLMSRGKGYEYVIEALPKIVQAHPDAVFVVIGETHPARQAPGGRSPTGTRSRRAPRSLASSEHVVFHDEFLDTKALTDFLSTADVCVTPYLNREQIVSGVLSYALGAGKAIVSTAYRYAEEMLADGRGRLVPFRDSEAIATEVIDLLSNDTERQAMRKQAYTFARNMVWSDVGAQYLEIFREARHERGARPRIHQARTLQSTRPRAVGAASRSPACPHRRDRHSSARPLQRSRPQSRLLHRRQCPGADRRPSRPARPAERRFARAGWPTAISASCSMPSIRKPGGSAISWATTATGRKRSAARMPMAARSGRSARPCSTRRRPA